MWEGPRGGPPFRGDHRREMFGWRDHPMPACRGRDGMNMGPMGHIGPRPNMPPFDMRRMDGPPMRGHDMDLHNMRRREPNRDFFRQGEDDFGPRRQYDVSVRDKMMNAPGFPGPNRNLGDNGGMPPREPNKRFMDMREPFRHDMQRFNNPNDGRRGFFMDRMERNDGFRNMYDRPPMDFGGDEHYEIDMPPHEKRMMDTDRRGGPPFNPRGRFDSDMDFRNRPGPIPDFRGRERSPSRFVKSGGPSGDRVRSDMPSDVDPQTQGAEFMGAKEVSEREYPESSDSPLMDYRSGEEMTLAEEWKKRQQDKNPLLGKNMEAVSEPTFPVGFHRDVNIRDSSPFPERDRAPFGFPGKDVGFPHGDLFPGTDLQSVGSKGPKDVLLPELNPPNIPKPDGEDKHWLAESNSEYIKKESHNEAAPYHKERITPSHEIQELNDCLKGMEDLPQDQGPPRNNIDEGQDFQSSSAIKPRDQDYRDIDYRMGSGRVFDYNPDELQAPEKLLEDSQQITPSKFTDSGSQDQDYRNASVKEKVSNIISITGIPKTATTDQILAAFAVRDGVPVQGMKIKNVVPGYSYDMAYVEFLNLEDAVHFMESNKGSLKVGTKTTSMKYIQPDECESGVHESDHKAPQPQDLQLSGQEEPFEEFENNSHGSIPKGPLEQPPNNVQWQRSSDLTPEAWQQQVDQQLLQQETEQQAEFWGNHSHPQQGSQDLHPVFKDSKTMIIKNVKPTTTVETILKALDPFAYLDERNVRLVKGKPLGKKRFCFVDMDSHEQVTRLVELLTKPKPLYIDGVRVYAEVAKPLRNQNFKRDLDSPTTSILGHSPEAGMMMHQAYPQPPPFLQPLQPPPGIPPSLEGDLMSGCVDPALSFDPGMTQDIGCVETPAVAPLHQTGGPHVPTDSVMTAPTDVSQTYIFGSEIPDTSGYLYDSTSGFYYDPETTLYYDPNSRYFYNAQTQEYLYWDATSKTYIPVPGGYSADAQTVTMTAEDQAILSNPAADAPLEMKKPSVPPEASASMAALTDSGPSSTPEAMSASTAPSDKKEDDDTGKKDKEKDEKPRSLAAVKIMKDMERWAKIQNRQKDSVRSPSPVLKMGIDDDKRQSKSADAAFAVFERKISGSDDLFKKPLAPGKKDEKSKRPMGSLGLLASDYAAGSDEEVEEDKEEAAKSSQTIQGNQAEDKEDKLTDWKKMACLLCRRQFPNKDALIRHQQLSDLHKQNMEIHLKIKRSKKELEALENQERELNARETPRSPEQKRRKVHHQQPQPRNAWAGSSREMNKVSERPGLGAEPVQPRKKEPVVWDHNTYKQAVRKAMFARFKELE